MSQFWHANWAEDAFKPAMLGNWQVPNWHPKWPCARHCATTTFLADKTGRLLAGQPRSKRSPWGDYKGTWELPLKINRRLAERLSAPPKYKLAAWEAHKKHYEGPCGIIPANLRRDKTAYRGTDPRKASNENSQRTVKNVAKKIAERTTTERKVEDYSKKNDAKTKSAERKTSAKKDSAKTRFEKPKGEKSVAGEAKNDKERKIAREDNDKERKIAREDNDKEEIVSRPEDDEIETVIKDRSPKRFVQETKKDERLKCPCTKNDRQSGETPEIRRRICTIHQRLRV